MTNKKIKELVDTLMDKPDEVKKVLFTLNDESDLDMLYREIDYIISWTSDVDDMERYDRARDIRGTIEREIDGRSLEEYRKELYNVGDLVDMLMENECEVKKVLLTLNDESDLIMLLREIDDMIFETSLAGIKEINDRARDIRGTIEIELNGRSLEEYRKESYYELADEPIEDILNFSSDEYREKWLEDLLNVELKRIDTESDKDLITLQKEFLEAKSNNRPINENPRAMFLVLKYYEGDGALFAISDSLRNNPQFMERIINDYPGALDLSCVDEATWAEVARMSNDDELKSDLLNKRLMEDLKYKISEYYVENSERYGLEDILKYGVYLEYEDIPYSDCNDVTLLEYVIKQKGDRGEPLIPAKELSKYYGLVAQKDDNLKSITLRAIEEQTMEMSNLVGQKARKTSNEKKSIEQEEISPELEAGLNDEQTPLQKKEKELSALEKEEKTINEAEALIEKQNGKDGQDIGE